MARDIRWRGTMGTNEAILTGPGQVAPVAEERLARFVGVEAAVQPVKAVTVSAQAAVVESFVQRDAREALGVLTITLRRSPRNPLAARKCPHRVARAPDTPSAASGAALAMPMAASGRRASRPVRRALWRFCPETPVNRPAAGIEQFYSVP